MGDLTIFHFDFEDCFRESHRRYLLKRVNDGLVTKSFFRGRIGIEHLREVSAPFRLKALLKMDKSLIVREPLDVGELIEYYYVGHGLKIKRP